MTWMASWMTHVGWAALWQVMEQALPPGMTKVVARRILFIGKAVRVLKHTRNSSERAGMLTPELLAFPLGMQLPAKLSM
jgi:hypothetical protein